MDIGIVDEKFWVPNVKARKLKRFNYIPAFDELLFICVREHDAHKASYGKKMGDFEPVSSSVS